MINTKIKRFILINRCEDAESFALYSLKDMEDYFRKWQIWLNKLHEDGNPAVVEILKPKATLYIKNQKQEEFDFEEGSAAGICIINAANWEEAAKIARTSPIIEEGGSCELREIFDLASELYAKV